MLACRKLEWETISAIVRDTMTKADATPISLVENVHRADMNPIDKAKAIKTLADKFGSFQDVSRETGVGASPIRKYIRLLALAPELQKQLAAGEARNTQALARLAQQVTVPENQVKAWHEVSGFTQDVQQEIIKRLDSNLDDLDDLVDDAMEGTFGYYTVRNCPYDCPTIPDALKDKVA